MRILLVLPTSYRGWFTHFGKFFWLERCPGLPISQAIAQVLPTHQQ